MDNNKKVGLILLISTIVVITCGGIGYMAYEHHVKEEQTKLIKKSAKQIDEFYKWNYIGVNKTTTSNHTWVNPASGGRELNYTVYFNGDKDVLFTADYETKGIYLEPFSKEVKEKPIIKVPESAEYNNKADYYLLTPKDIDKLKKKGFTSDISGSQIKQELLKLHPTHFKKGNK